MASGRAAAMILEAARAFRPRILAERERIEADRRLPEELTRDLAREGFFRIFLPAAYGGLDLTPMEAMEVYEELARADASVAWCVWNGNVHWTTARLSPKVAQTIFADPEMILANSTRPTGQAVVVEDGYRLSGRWSLVSGCQLSTWFILMSVVHEDGKPRLTPSGAPEFRYMLCPAADCEIVDTWRVGGLRGTGSHDVVVRDLFVPASHASFYTDPVVLPDPRYAFPVHSRAASGLGMIVLGIARSAIETLVGLAVEKRHERTSQSLREDRGAQGRLAQAEALVRSARLYLFDTVSQLWEDVRAGREATIEGRVQVRLAGWHAVSAPPRQWTWSISPVGRSRSMRPACWSAPSGTYMLPRSTSASTLALWRPPVGLCSDWSRTLRRICCDIRQGLPHDVVMRLFALHRQEDQLTNAVLVTAARLRIGMNVNSLGWAAARDGGR